MTLTVDSRTHDDLDTDPTPDASWRLPRPKGTPGLPPLPPAGAAPEPGTRTSSVVPPPPPPSARSVPTPAPSTPSLSTPTTAPAAPSTTVSSTTASAATTGEPDAPASAASGCVIASGCRVQTATLLAERARLTRQLAGLDAESERLARAVQRVGGLGTGVRPFTGAAPLRVSSSLELEADIKRLEAEMKQLTADISRRELELQALERPSPRRKWVAALVVVVILAAAAVAIVLAVA